MSDECFIYVGGYSRDPDDGIRAYRMDSNAEAIDFLGIAPGIPNPSFLAIHPRHPFLYAVNETDQTDGKPGGGVSSFAIDPKTGALTPVNRRSSEGGGPCYVSLDKTGSVALVANYGTGSIAVLPIREDGGLEAATCVIQHRGSSVDPGRQEGPHAHSIAVDPTNRFALAADLGLDQVLIYRLDVSKGALTLSDVQPHITLPPGSGPRHFAFHPNGRHLYVINEMGNSIVAWDYDGEGEFAETQRISTLPEGFAGTSYCAEILVSPSGSTLYGSNRGHDSIAIYRIDAATGALSFAGCEPTLGKFPRNFVIDPSGRFLFAANQNSNQTVVFRIDPQTGGLTPTGRTIDSPSPSCIKFVKAAE